MGSGDLLLSKVNTSDVLRLMEHLGIPETWCIMVMIV